MGARAGLQGYARIGLARGKVGAGDEGAVMQLGQGAGGLANAAVDSSGMRAGVAGRAGGCGGGDGYARVNKLKARHSDHSVINCNFKSHDCMQQLS